MPDGSGSRVTICYKDQIRNFYAPLIGVFQIENLLCAMGLALAGGLSFNTLIGSIPRIVNVRGRMDLVGQSQSKAKIYIDYAHTPDALYNALSALRMHTSGKLYVLFGCGGERDVGKRALMGKVAGQLADHVFVTDDNPRGEDPALIRSQIISSCPKSNEFEDRAGAIEFAIHQLNLGDTLLIAGKGHETDQIVSGRRIPFSDRQVVREFVGPGDSNDEVCGDSIMGCG